MVFNSALQPEEHAVFAALGYPRGQRPDDATNLLWQTASDRLQQVAAPRWAWRRFPLQRGGVLAGADIRLLGRDITAHLAGCSACILLGLTLGAQVDEAIRGAEAADMGLAVLLDTSASVLAEQYADEAERLLRAETEQNGEYLTGRFSPGYGNFPLALQQDMVRLLDAPRQIGLSMAPGGALVPRKSITAVLGVAGQPVSGRLAGCAGCALAEKCAYKGTKETKNGGGHCGTGDF